MEGEGGAADVTREACARAAAAVLASSDTRAGRVKITGPEVVTYSDLAKIVSELTGREVSYLPVEPAIRKAGMIAGGVPEVFTSTIRAMRHQSSRAKFRWKPATKYQEADSRRRWHGWFTEDFDTTDRQAAKALLEALA